MNVEINTWAVIAATVAGTVVGFIWYSPILFGNVWAKLRGIKPNEVDQKEAGKSYAISIIFTLITAYVLAHVMGLSQAFYNYSALSTGLTTAFWMWLGFVMPTQATATLFSDKKQKPWGLFGIDTGYQLAALLVMGLVIGLFK